MRLAAAMAFTFGIFFLARACVPAQTACRFVSDVTDPITVPAHFGPNIGVQVQMTVNDHPLWFMLDTGAGGLAIDNRVAKSADLPFVSRGVVRGDVAIGPLRATNCRFRTISGMQDRTQVQRADGLIGAELLRSDVVMIDFPHRQVTIYPEGAFDPQPLLKYQELIDPSVANYTVVHAWFGNKRATMLLDTGAAMTTIFAAFARDITLGNPVTDFGTAQVGVGAKTTPVLIFQTRPLTFGHVRFEKTEAVVADDEPEWLKEHAIDGIIGRNILQLFRLTIDYGHHVIYLER